MEYRYETPQIELTEIAAADIITASNDDGKLIDGGADGKGDITNW